jgi:hypothetical protein
MLSIIFCLSFILLLEIRWAKGGTEQVEDCTFWMDKEMKIIIWGPGFFVCQRTVSEVKRLEFVGDRISYIVVRGCWCNIIVLNTQAPTEDKRDESVRN